MFIFLILILTIVNCQLKEQAELTNAACVIFSRFYLQNNQHLAGEALGEIVQKGLNKDEALMAMQVAAADQCLSKITSQETMGILQSLQSQNLDLNSYSHLIQGVDLTKYGNKKKSARKNEILKIIQQIDDLIQQQKKEYEASGGKLDEDVTQEKKGKKGRKSGANSSDKSVDISLFDLREWAVLSSFILVGVLLSYIICCLPTNSKSKQIKQQKQKVRQQQKKQEQEQNNDDDDEDEDVDVDVKQASKVDKLD